MASAVRAAARVGKGGVGGTEGEWARLWPDAASGQIGHAQRVVRRVELDGVEDLGGRRDDVLLIQLLVAAGVAGGGGGERRVVGAEEAALAAVDHLRRLRREARGARVAGAAELDVVPADAEGVRAVLDDDEVELVGELVDGLHVGDLPAHVRQQQVRRHARHDLRAQVVGVHHVGVGRLDVHRRRAGVVDRRRHRGEREGVRQHVVARLHARRLQRDEERRAARVEADAVLEARRLAHVGLRQRRLGEVARRVPEERAALHQLERPLLALHRHRVGRRERLAERRALGHRGNLLLEQPLERADGHDVAHTRSRGRDGGNVDLDCPRNLREQHDRHVQAPHRRSNRALLGVDVAPLRT